MEKIYMAALQMTPGIGSARMKAVLDYFGSAQSAWEAGVDDLLASKTIGESVCGNLVKFRQKTDLQQKAWEWRQKDVSLCCLDEPEYPELLRNIFNPPYILYYQGALPQAGKTIAIVGSRQASPYGKNTARLLASGLSEQGIWIVSGAARGIDTAAHQGALPTGRTIAVLGSGVDVAYPPENGGLLKAIAEKGAVISEYPPGTPPHPGHFPSRNRIISGMSRGVVIVEAGNRSGALITADLAMEEGRDVFAIPGNIFSQNSQGTNKLIKQGAKLVNGLVDILEEYDWTDSAGPENRVSPPLGEEKKEALPAISTEEKIIYDILEYEKPLSMEEIVMKSNLPTSVAAFALLQLGLNGLTGEVDGRCYIRVK